MDDIFHNARFQKLNSEWNLLVSQILRYYVTDDISHDMLPTSAVGNGHKSRTESILPIKTLESRNRKRQNVARHKIETILPQLNIIKCWHGQHSEPFRERFQDAKTDLILYSCTTEIAVLAANILNKVDVVQEMTVYLFFEINVRSIHSKIIKVKIGNNWSLLFKAYKRRTLNLNSFSSSCRDCNTRLTITDRRKCALVVRNRKDRLLSSLTRANSDRLFHLKLITAEKKHSANLSVVNTDTTLLYKTVCE